MPTYYLIRGKVTGVNRVLLSGFDKNIQKTGTPKTLWPLPGFIADLQNTAPVEMEVVSTSPLDTALGAGARTVRVLLVSASTLDGVNQTITLNGTTPVPITPGTPYLGVNNISITSIGTFSGSNIGDITVRTVGTPGQVHGIMPAGYSIEQSCHRRGFIMNSLDIISLAFSVAHPDGKDVSAVVSMVRRSPEGIKLKEFPFSGNSNSGPYKYDLGIAGPFASIGAGAMVSLEVDEVSKDGTAVYASLLCLNWNQAAIDA